MCAGVDMRHSDAVPTDTWRRAESMRRIGDGEDRGNDGTIRQIDARCDARELVLLCGRMCGVLEVTLKMQALLQTNRGNHEGACIRPPLARGADLGAGKRQRRSRRSGGEVPVSPACRQLFAPPIHGALRGLETCTHGVRLDDGDAAKTRGSCKRGPLETNRLWYRPHSHGRPKGASKPGIVSLLQDQSTRGVAPTTSFTQATLDTIKGRSFVSTH